MNEIIEANAKTERQRRAFEAIKRRTEKRPLLERYKVIRNLGIYGTAATFVVSFLTGISFFYYFFNMGVYAALFAAVLIEAFRTYTFDAFWRIAYEEKTFSPPLQITALFGLLFLFISFATSLYGSKWGYEAFDKDAQKEKASHKLDLASLRKGYETKAEAATRAYQTDATLAENRKRVDSEKKALADFKASIMWQGAINISDPQVAGNISTFNARISALETENIRYAKSRQAQYEAQLKQIEADKNTLISAETSDHQEKYGEAKAKTEFNTWVWIVIAVVVEVFAVAFAFLPHWYDNYCSLSIKSFEPTLTPIQQAYQALGQVLPFLTAKTMQGLTSNAQVLPNNLQEGLLQVMNQDNSQDLQEPIKKKPIGFNRDKPDLQGLLQALQAGETYIPALMKQYKVNPAHVDAGKVLLNLKEDAFGTIAKSSEYLKVSKHLPTNSAKPKPSTIIVPNGLFP